MSTENVTHLPGQGPDQSPEAAVERFERIFGEDFADALNHYVLRGTGAEAAYEELIDDAAPLAALIAGIDTKNDRIPDNAVNHAAWLIERLLRMGQAIRKYEHERRDAEREAREQQEEREREERDKSPAGLADTIGFVAGISERSRGVLEPYLDDLEAQDAQAAEIVRARLGVGRGATLFVADDGPSATSVTLRDHNGDLVERWTVDHGTAEALRPLAAEQGGGQEAAGGS